MADGDPLADVLAQHWMARAMAQLSEDDRRAVLAVRDGALDAASIARALAALRPHATALGDVANALSRIAPAALCEALLPGAAFASAVDVRLYRARNGERLGFGDLTLVPHREGGAGAIVATLQGVRALHELPRDVRAAVRELRTVEQLTGDAEGARLLAAVDWLGVHQLAIDNLPPAHAAALVLRCPSLASYSGPMTADVADAIATTAMTVLTLGNADDTILANLARSAHLECLVLRIFRERAGLTPAGLAALGRLASLRQLTVSSCAIDDAELAAICTIRSLEMLFAYHCDFTDASGIRLADLTRLVALDAYGTRIGDATLAALATLPALADLDITNTRATPAGIAQLAHSQSLKHLGIAWDADISITHAAKALAGVDVVESDYMHSMGALWCRNEFDMLA